MCTDRTDRPSDLLELIGNQRPVFVCGNSNTLLGYYSWRSLEYQQLFIKQSWKGHHMQYCSPTVMPMRHKVFQQTLFISKTVNKLLNTIFIHISPFNLTLCSFKALGGSTLAKDTFLWCFYDFRKIQNVSSDKK
jgi:hypothetical protein